MAKEANFAFSGDFADDEPELAQCDCCSEMWPIDDIHFIPADRCSVGDTYACPVCRQEHKYPNGPTEAELKAYRERCLKVFGPEVIAEWEKDALPVPTPDQVKLGLTPEKLALERKRARFNSVLPTRFDDEEPE